MGGYGDERYIEIQEIGRNQLRDGDGGGRAFGERDRVTVLHGIAELAGAAGGRRGAARGVTEGGEYRSM